MAELLVPDELWEAVAPLLPRHKARPGKRGRPPVDDRACLTGIVFVLRSGIPWEMLPQEMGCGSGVTCWRGCGTGSAGASGRSSYTPSSGGSDKRRGSTGNTAVWTAKASAPFLGGADGQEPHRSGQKGHEAAPPRRWQRHSVGPADHRSQPQPVARGDGPGGRDPADPWAARPAAADTEGLVWGPPVWHAAKSSGPRGAKDRRPSGTAADATRQRPGPNPLGCGEHTLWGRPGPAPESPLREAASDASGFPLPSPRPDLLQGAPEGFLK
jgi:transposase